MHLAIERDHVEAVLFLHELSKTHGFNMDIRSKVCLYILEGYISIDLKLIVIVSPYYWRLNVSLVTEECIYCLYTYDYSQTILLSMPQRIAHFPFHYLMASSRLKTAQFFITQH